MHKYIKAIGFHDLKLEKEVNMILEDVKNNFTSCKKAYIEDSMFFYEFSKEYGDGIGISSYYQIDSDDYQQREYYVPYFKGSGITSYSDIIVEHRSDKEAYIGICEDSRVGVSLIFHLQNCMEYLEEIERGQIPKRSTSLTLSGLATEGTVLLPVMKNQEQVNEKKEESRNRMMLLSAAREGNTEAIESLTLDDIDIYSEVSQRIRNEDIYSIVDTYLMPYGVECDQYSIMGEILDINYCTNEITGKEICKLTLDVNELKFDICIPGDKITGEPAIGRRLKTNIWMQGYINF